METRDERKAREAMHEKKQSKKPMKYKKGLTPSHKEKNWKNKLLTEGTHDEPEGS